MFDITILENLQIVVTEIVEGDVGSSKLIVVVIFVKLIFGYSSSPIRRRPFFKVRKGPILLKISMSVTHSMNRAFKIE